MAGILCWLYPRLWKLDSTASSVLTRARRKSLEGMNAIKHSTPFHLYHSHTMFYQLGRRPFASVAHLLLIAFLMLLVSSGPPFAPISKPHAQEDRPLLMSEVDKATGGIRGVVRIESKIHSRSFPLNLYARKGTVPLRNQPAAPVNEVENVVVYLDDNIPDAGEALSKPRAPAGLQPAVRQLNEMFIPHVLPIIVGTIVQFPNEDPFFHNVFSLSGAKSFDLGRYPKSQTRSVRFNRPGIVKIFCHIHSHMNAVILVFGHPHFCVPEAKGSFNIDDIPPGRHTLVVWHERLKPYRQVINIAPGTHLTLDVVL